MEPRAAWPWLSYGRLATQSLRVLPGEERTRGAMAKAQEAAGFSEDERPWRFPCPIR